MILQLTLALELLGAALAGALATLAAGVWFARRQFRKMRSPRVLS